MSGRSGTASSSRSSSSWTTKTPAFGLGPVVVAAAVQAVPQLEGDTEGLTHFASVGRKVLVTTEGQLSHRFLIHAVRLTAGCAFGGGLPAKPRPERLASRTIRPRTSKRSNSPRSRPTARKQQSRPVRPACSVQYLEHNDHARDEHGETDQAVPGRER